MCLPSIVYKKEGKSYTKDILSVRRDNVKNENLFLQK